MLNGLDLFSGIAGITVALSSWVQPVAYCENDRYAQGVLLSRMADGQISLAPIWDDVKTLRAEDLPCSVDIIYGGFPCQDISIAGIGKGLEGERSGLFFEIIRLAKEIKPSFIFLENVPAITTRGGLQVVKAITEIGYDCRWCTLSAAEVGANHRRERWWLLAYSSYERCNNRSDNWEERHVQNAEIREAEKIQQEGNERIIRISETCAVFPDPDSEKCARLPSGEKKGFPLTGGNNKHIFESKWWETEPDVGRVVNGLSNRMDRIKSLGNAVVPFQAREAFKELMGI